MGKPFAMYALCIISAAFGAAIDHYLAGAIEQSGPHLERAVSPQGAVAAPSEQNVEVLGDRVRCDFRYQELKIPATEYQSFKRKCMGDKWDGDYHPVADTATNRHPADGFGRFVMSQLDRRPPGEAPPTPSKRPPSCARESTVR
jgi:hypothetical protein